jgi:hypothetical protein
MVFKFKEVVRQSAIESIKNYNERHESLLCVLVEEDHEFDSDTDEKIFNFFSDIDCWPILYVSQRNCALHAILVSAHANKMDLPAQMNATTLRVCALKRLAKLFNGTLKSTSSVLNVRRLFELNISYYRTEMSKYFKVDFQYKSIDFLFEKYCIFMKDEMTCIDNLMFAACSMILSVNLSIMYNNYCLKFRVNDGESDNSISYGPAHVNTIVLVYNTTDNYGQKCFGSIYHGDYLFWGNNIKRMRGLSNFAKKHEKCQFLENSFRSVDFDYV